MKIPDNLQGLGGTGLGGASGAERARGAESLSPGGANRSSAGSSDPDRVQLSGLSQALRAAHEDSPEQLEKVDQLRADYKAGRYQAQSLEASKKIISEAIQEKKGGPA